MDKPLPDTKAAKVEGGNQIKTLEGAVDLVARGKNRADDSPAATYFLFLLYLNNTFFFMYILDICPTHLFPSFNFIFSSSYPRLVGSSKYAFIFEFISNARYLMCFLSDA